MFIKWVILISLIGVLVLHEESDNIAERKMCRKDKQFFLLFRIYCVHTKKTSSYARELWPPGARNNWRLCTFTVSPYWWSDMNSTGTDLLENPSLMHANLSKTPYIPFSIGAKMQASSTGNQWMSYKPWILKRPCKPWLLAAHLEGFPNKMKSKLIIDLN